MCFLKRVLFRVLVNELIAEVHFGARNFTDFPTNQACGRNYFWFLPVIRSRSKTEEVFSKLKRWMLVLR